MSNDNDYNEATWNKLDLAEVKKLFERYDKSLFWAAAVIKVAFSHPDPYIAKYLLDQDLPINFRDNSGIPAFVYSIGYRNPDMEMLHRLIDAGLDIDQDEKVAFIFAASCPDLNVLKFFVEKGAKIGPDSKTGKTLLHQAAKGNCNTAILEYLIDELKLDINAETIFGDTPLSLAGERNEHIEVTQFLLDKGADPNRANRYGRLAVEKARPGKKAIIRKAMRKSGKKDEKIIGIERINIVAAISNPKGIAKETLGIPYPDKAWYFDYDEDLCCTPDNRYYSGISIGYVRMGVTGLYPCYDICYFEISEELILALVDYLDGQSDCSSYLWLNKSKDEQLSVYGGNEDWFLCSVYSSVKNQRFVEIVNEANKNGPEVVVNIDGQEDGFSGDQVVKRDDAKKIAIYYMNHGMPHPDYKWE